MKKREISHAEMEAHVEDGGGPARAARQRRLGRGMPRDRIAALCDPGSFVELQRYVRHDLAHASELLAAQQHPGDGVVCGVGTVDGRPVAVVAHDPTVLRGSIGRTGAGKICRLLVLAAERRLPVVTLADSDGARVPEGMDAIFANSELLRRTVELRGVVPQITVACGLCVGVAAYAAALNDLVCMVAGQSFMFVTGPKVTKVATGEDVAIEDLGGPELHARKTGSCHAIVPDEASGIAWARRLLAFLPGLPGAGSDRAAPDAAERETPALETLVPVEPRRAYDVRKVVAELFDSDSVLEVAPLFAPSLLTFFARLDGRPVAVLASQPMHHGGVLDGVSSRKGAAQLRRARAWDLPVVTLVDVPGYRPGKKEEEAGILPFGAELIAAYGEARGRVPLIAFLLRKSFGGGNVLASGADVRLALPSARVAPMGVDAALEVELGPLLEGADDESRAARERAREEWLDEHDHVWSPAESGYVDEVIAPAQARRALVRTLRALCSLPPSRGPTGTIAGGR